MIRSSLFTALLTAVILCTATAAKAQAISANPADNLQSKLDAAVNGTLTLGAGTFNVNGPLLVHAGTTIQGADNLTSHVVFSLSGQNLYGFVVEANARNVTIAGLDIHSSNGVLRMADGGGYNAIHFVANNVQFGGGTMPDGTLVFGIFGSIGCDDLQVTWNYFHDSFSSVRNWEVWGEKNSHLDHNLFFNIDDGGHCMEATLNNTFSWNYGTNMHRMGQEIQGTGQNESGLVCDHDVFYDYVNAYNDSEGISMCPNFTTGVVVSNGYFRNSFAAGSGFGTMTGGAVGGPNRFGYAIESIGPGILCQNNTIVLSNLSADAIASGVTTTVNNCTVYGGNNALWGVWGPDYGPNGKKGTFTLGSGSAANTINATLDGAPLPPPNTFAGPAIYAATRNGTLWTPTWTPAASSAPNAQTNLSVPPTSQPTSPTLTHTIQVMSDGSVNVN